MRKELTKAELHSLRMDGTVSALEIAYVMGDLLLIENVKSGEKRAVNHPIVDSYINEGKKQILKG